MGTQGIIFWQFQFIVEQASSLFSSPKNCCAISPFPLAHQTSSVELASVPVAAIWAYAIQPYRKICNDSDQRKLVPLA